MNIETVLLRLPFLLPVVKLFINKLRRRKGEINSENMVLEFVTVVAFWLITIPIFWLFLELKSNSTREYIFQFIGVSGTTFLLDKWFYKQYLELKNLAISYLGLLLVSIMGLIVGLNIANFFLRLRN
ncbi:hypothetical protein A2960_03460 [Candidatus Gottesmanbacteria bacterium RIFCSPLOWO2_01_FULL_39_12b]|uniref:Uncharacterized protein n=1 Tax=Candidatus Gottesmanbacteria bacterium RIFCSPLOWO2_01_FULL_39_12b TaxID=1798388 RepID=A0A1F6APF2_9BACT|nr:MAG: hypothetical protein A2960_03460 [Candidatus Gottesmanbacteria bacterium RIFCSPLOWO2_01_FULL_39_12b]